MKKNKKHSFLEELIALCGLEDNAPEFYKQLGLYYQRWNYWKKLENAHKLPIRYDPALEEIAYSYGVTKSEYRALKQKHFMVVS